MSEKTRPSYHRAVRQAQRHVAICKQVFDAHVRICLTCRDAVRSQRMEDLCDEGWDKGSKLAQAQYAVQTEVRNVAAAQARQARLF